MQIKIETNNLSKSFSSLDVLHDINITVKDREFVSIIGPSGCGKSSLFKILTGLDKDYTGSVVINHQDIKEMEPNVSYMPQKDLLLPWKNVVSNVTLPLKIKRETISKESLEELLELFGLTGFESAYPHHLSGGMRQRAALLRTMLMGNDILLLDEPFGAIDSINRLKLQKWLFKVVSKFKQTILFITHDIDEAIFLSNRIIVLSDRPAQVIGEIEINTSEERNEGFLTSEEFNHYKQQILKLLKL